MSEEKKATVRDIAKKANVSVATVSYVLNDKEGAKISENTRKRVLQVANLLNYKIPEKYKSDSQPKDNYSIGVVYSLNPDTPSRNSEIMQLISLLGERFSRMKYSFLLIPIEPSLESYEPANGLDGIIAIDLSEHDFKIVSGSYFVPVLCLDMMINDFLFYQIHTDIETILNKGRETLGDDFYLITENCYNEGYLKYLSSTMPEGKTLIISEFSEKNIKKLKGKKALALGAFLGMELLQFLPASDVAIVSTLGTEAHGAIEAAVIHNDLDKKANLAMNIMMNALEKKFDVKHEYKIC